MSRNFRRAASVMMTILMFGSAMSGCTKQTEGEGASKRDDIIIATMGETPSMTPNE